MAGTIQDLEKAFKSYTRVVTLAMEAATDLAAETLLTQMHDDVSMEDHTQKQLDEMGNPYNWAHAAGNLHPDWQVHMQHQDGLRSDLTKTDAVNKNGIVTAEIHSGAPYTWYLLLGTVKMRPRDFVSAALIKQKAACNQIYESAWKQVNQNVQAGRMEQKVTLIPHETYPAQLPGE